MNNNRGKPNYTSTHSLAEVQQLLGHIYEVVDSPRFENEQIEYWWLSRSGRYVLAETEYTKRFVTWDLEKGKLRELQLKSFDRKHIRSKGITKQGNAIAVIHKSNLYRLSEDNPPELLWQVPKDYSPGEISSVHLNGDWMVISFNVELDLEEGYLFKPTNEDKYKEAFIVWNLAENIQYDPKVEDNDEAIANTVEGIATNGVVFGNYRNFGSFTKPNFSEVSRIDPAPAFDELIFCDQIGMNTLIGKGITYTQLRNQHSIVTWNQKDGIQTVPGFESEFLYFRGVTDSKIVALYCELISRSTQTILWKLNTPLESAVNLNDAVMNRPDELYYYHFFQPIAKNGWIIASAAEDQDVNKRHLLKPVQLDEIDSTD